MKELFLEHVLLTPDEYKKLVDRLGKSDTEFYIGELDYYISNKGKNPYKSHYRTILQWSRRNEKKAGSDKKKVVFRESGSWNAIRCMFTGPNIDQQIRKKLRELGGRWYVSS
ncbi:MAG: hypothetical protein PVG39_30795 [Desulfobacteraceae bacterium]|jgi:hypothetical protein